MVLPFDTVVRRGAVLLWRAYEKLDDPRFAGQTKPKFLVVLTESPLDDPIIYILTTSKSPTARHPWPADLLTIPSGAYAFFPLETSMDAGTAGQTDVGTAELRALYDGGSVLYQGSLTTEDVGGLMEKIRLSPRVSRRVKAVLGCT